VARPVVLGIDDAGEVLTLQRAAYVPEARAHADLDLPPLLQTLDELLAELGDPSVQAWGRRDAGMRLVAAVRVRLTGAPGHRAADIGRLTVAPDRQGRGLGTSLLEAVEQQLPGDVGTLRLFTGENSEANLRLYARLGYVETGRQRAPAGYHLVHLSKPRRLLS
jgi:ribosomal protein S18 acetylase RimI-like enzyme